MKSIKRVLALVLAMVLCLGLATVAMATDASETGTITVKNAQPGATYHLYKVFGLAAGSTSGSRTYTVDNATLEAKLATSSYFGVAERDGVKVVTLKQGVTGTESGITEELASWFKADNTIFGTAVGNETGGAANAGSNFTTVTFTGLSDGYYYLDSSSGSLVGINTLNGETNIEIEDKNGLPFIEKEESENNPTDPKVGDTLNYTISLTVDKTHENYTVDDTMTAMTYAGNLSVTHKRGDTSSSVSADSYVFTEKDGRKGFRLEFTSAFMQTLQENDVITITYDALITAEALTEDKTDNIAKLEYGNMNKVTPVDGSNKHEYDGFVLNKVDDNNEPLAGAEFELYQGTTKIDMVQVTEGEGETATVYYRPAVAGETLKTGETSVTVIPAGSATIRGLAKNGSYNLKETKAPADYNILTAEQAVTANGEEVTVVNHRGTNLPSTGGIGTTIFYVVGGILIVGAGVLLVTKKRMAHHD